MANNNDLFNDPFGSDMNNIFNIIKLYTSKKIMLYVVS